MRDHFTIHGLWPSSATPGDKSLENCPIYDTFNVKDLTPIKCEYFIFIIFSLKIGCTNSRPMNLATQWNSLEFQIKVITFSNSSRWNDSKFVLNEMGLWFLLHISSSSWRSLAFSKNQQSSSVLATRMETPRNLWSLYSCSDRSFQVPLLKPHSFTRMPLNQ